MESFELEGTAESPDMPWYFIRFDFAGVEEWRFDQPRYVGPSTIIFEAAWADLGDLVYVAFDGVNIDADRRSPQRDCQSRGDP